MSRRITRGLGRRARGIALLIVLVVLVLIATLATEIAITARMHHTLSLHSMDGLILRTAVDGRVEILKAALRYDGTNGSGFDGDADEWSFHNTQKLSGWGERGTSSFGTTASDSASGGNTSAYSNTDVQLQAWCEDERSKLNLRGLMKPDETDVFKHTRDTLIRLIDLYRDKYSNLDLSDGDAKEMVDDLVKWLQAEADTQDNPMPAVKANRGRLQSVDDLLRVPGGHWTASRLFDVKDPNAVDDSDPTASTMTATSSPSSSSSSSTTSTDDATWERPNGVPGLWRYLTVFAETTIADPPMRINVNTASVLMLRALFDQNDEDLAEKIVEYRRQGASDSASSSTSPTSSTSGTSGTSGAADATQNYFKTKADLSKVDGMEKDLTKYPRLNYFADVTSSVYSLRVIAQVGKGGGAASSTSGGAAADDANSAPKEIDAVYQYRQVVQRTGAGFLTLFTETRSDPILAASTQ